MILLPAPQSINFSGSTLRLPDRVPVAFPDTLPPFDRFLHRCSELTGKTWSLFSSEAQVLVRFELCPALSREAYVLRISPGGIDIRVSGRAGVLHAAQTFYQILAQHGHDLPCLNIEDAPACAQRGYLLDISRDKVPTISTLRELITQLASLKYNQLQLYTEHTFAYPGHEAAWGLASPLTAEEVRELDEWCWLHGVELVPCINTFGHFERWLRHPDYRHLAECPFGWMRPDGHGMSTGSTLRPGDNSLDFLERLMEEYLPLFRSRRVNIGGDEPWELGMGVSRARCEAFGRHRVYLDFLRQIIEVARRHKDVVQFWSDIVLEDPDAWNGMPEGSEGLIWGYEAGHPFASQAATFTERTVPHLLCPGTSTWNSLGARLGNALENIAEAGNVAATAGSLGMILTDWGDFGHHQPDLLSVPAIHAFAQAAWNPKSPLPDLAESIAHFTFRESIPQIGPLLLELGTLYSIFDYRPPNRLPLVQILTTRQEHLETTIGPLSTLELERASVFLDDLRRQAEGLHALTSDGSLRKRELCLVLDLLQHACKRGLACRDGRGDRARLRSEFIRLIGQFETLWCLRNRIGGLHESSERLRTALATYPTQPPRRPAWPPAPA